MRDHKGKSEVELSEAALRREHQEKSKALLRPQQVSDRLNIGMTKFWELVKSGAFDVRYLGGSTRITEESVDAYIENLPKTKAA